MKALIDFLGTQAKWGVVGASSAMVVAGCECIDDIPKGHVDRALRYLDRAIRVNENLRKQSKMLDAVRSGNAVGPYMPDEAFAEAIELRERITA